MVFSSITFLFYFLPAVVLVYLLLPGALRNAFLLLASLVFYVWGGGAFIVILLISIATNFVFGALAGRARENGNAIMLAWSVAGSVVVSLSLLGYFKYANFLVEQLNFIGTSLGGHQVTWKDVVLPIGISFYTFQAMSYVFDIAKGISRPLRNPFDFALYVSLFPQLIAGPIVRFQDIESAIRKRTHGYRDVAEGTTRFCWGLVKKVVIADGAAQLAVPVFDAPPGDLSSGVAWVGALAYTVQIYFDFSGYTDMAIGLGRMFGFRFPENFRRPYSAYSVTDFWRRWHITLSTWFRDYVYIPLGGSWHGRIRTISNLWIVFLLTGIWHGANWTFILWGLYHGSLLIFERSTHRNYTDSAPAPALQRALTLFLVILGWVMFRANDIGHAQGLYTAMFSFNGASLDLLAPYLAPENVFVLVFGLSTVFLPRRFLGGQWILEGVGAAPALARAAMLLALLPYTLILVISGSFSPFLYFQF